MERYRFIYRRARPHWGKYRPRWWIGPPDPVLLQTMIDDGLFDQEET